MDPDRTPRPFNLRRWFLLVSLIVTSAVALVTGTYLSRFFVAEAIERDAVLTAQFIQALAETEIRHAALGPALTMGPFLDDRLDGARIGVDNDELARMRSEFFDHIRHLPDALLASVFAPDGTIVWSTNPELEDKRIEGNLALDETLRSKRRVAYGHLQGITSEHAETKLLRNPKDLYIENYIPMLDANGQVASVIEIYKEPEDLVRAIRRGYRLIWIVTLLAALAVYVALYGIVRRAAVLLDEQQRRLVENETLVAVGEMASAVAHGLRNPLASIRTSAELAIDADPPPRKNLDDIITQVDRMSKWVRELLLFSRPLSDERGGVDLARSIGEALRAFEPQIARAGIEVVGPRSEGALPRALANDALLAQALNSILSNAIEAMPKGGRLEVAIEPEPRRRRITLTVSDSGAGMSEKQLAMLFKPFLTTKRGGLGVGLALVKRIMERFGGEVRIESREKAGTQVHLSFRTAGDGGRNE
jgi:signal transduction histidine kinase